MALLKGGICSPEVHGDIDPEIPQAAVLAAAPLHRCLSRLDRLSPGKWWVVLGLRLKFIQH